MPRLVLFASAREAAGVGSLDVAGDTVGEVLEASVAMFGDRFARILSCSTVWLDGEEADRASPVGPDDEIVVLPPVSGG